MGYRFWASTWCTTVDLLCCNFGVEIAGYLLSLHRSRVITRPSFPSAGAAKPWKIFLLPDIDLATFNLLAESSCSEQKTQMATDSLPIFHFLWTLLGIQKLLYKKYAGLNYRRGNCEILLILCFQLSVPKILINIDVKSWMKVFNFTASSKCMENNPPPWFQWKFIPFVLCVQPHRVYTLYIISDMIKQIASDRQGMNPL